MFNKKSDEIENSVTETSNKLIFASDGGSNPVETQKPVRRKITFGIIANYLRSADIAILLLSGYIGFFLRFRTSASFTPADHLFIHLTTIVTVLSLYFAQSYQADNLLSMNKQLLALFVGGTSALFIILFSGYLSGTLQHYSRIWVVASIVIASILLMVNRIVTSILIHRAVDKKKITESIVIVGANQHAEKIIESIRQAPNSGIQILGIFDDRVRDRTLKASKSEIPSSLKCEILGSTDQLLAYIRRKHVCRVVVTLPWLTSERINALLKKLRTVPVRIDLVPNDVIWQFPNIGMERLANVPVLNIVNGRIERQGGIIKRVEDYLITFLTLLITFPLLILIAIAIKIDSKGPILFKQRRHGYNNNIFEVYKFRTMNADHSFSDEVKQATRNDPRITRVGRWLRQTSLDELPQLFNVLKGDMSIVGPRPHAVQHNMEYSTIISEYFARHNVKPGITGWAQINGLRGEIDVPEKMRRRVDADLYYIENWSLVFDIRIILLTAITVWFQKSAY